MLSYWSQVYLFNSSLWFFSGKSLVSDFSDLFVMRKNAQSIDNWNYNNNFGIWKHFHAHFLYIYYFNFVFFIVLSRIEINETHVNPYLLEPVCLLFISSSLYKIWCMFYTSVSLRVFGSSSVHVLDRTKREGVGYDETTRFLRWSATPDLHTNSRLF